MTVDSASMADKIIILDDDEEESPQPSCSATTSSSEHQARKALLLKDQQGEPTHIIQSPFASAKKDKKVLQAENEKLFAEFVEHCSSLTKDCPEVMTFLQTKHAKATPDYLCSVEFRNFLGRCLTRAQAKKSKTFVYINELCTVLKQHAVKKRQKLITVNTSSSGTPPSTSVSLKSKDKTKGKSDQEESRTELLTEEEQPSTSGLQANDEEGEEAEKKAKRASRKQIAYLENLLKVYNDEIHRLQQAELSIDELGAEDSMYIQEHKLKRKMMKIYEKLCELKDCNTLTGRVIEQRIIYRSTRYPEINKRIERFINRPEARWNPPDYPDILQQVLRADERHSLGLSRRQLNQIAQEAFRETGTCIQDRRQLDLAYNFGSHLTDNYSPRTDPAISDTTLLHKLRSNREQALSRLEEVITKYAVRQEDTEEQERLKRQEKSSKDKENHKSDKKAETKEANGVEEEEEEDDDEDDESSDPDIEEEIQASTQHDGPDDDDNEEDDNNEAEQACEGDSKEDQTYNQTGSLSAADEGKEDEGSVKEDEGSVKEDEGSVKEDEGSLKEEEGSVKEDEDEPVTSGSPISDETKSQISPLSDIPSPRDSPSQSEPLQIDDQQLLSNGNPEKLQEPVDSSNQVSVVFVKTNTVTTDTADASPAAADEEDVPSPQAVTLLHCDVQTTNGTSPPPTIRTTRSQKRKREEMMSDNPKSTKHIIIRDSETDIPLDMGVISCSSPQEAKSPRAQTPTQDLVSSSQYTPPPKKNKVNVATQCDPQEIIVLSDSE